MELNQVLTALRNADAAGDVEAAKRLSLIAKTMTGQERPEAIMSTEALQSAKAAPTSISDIARSFGSGVVGAGKSLVDVFGAGSDVSKYLGEVEEGLQKGLTPERQAEMARRAELSKRAEKEGTWAQIKSGLAGVAEAPLQSIAQGVGSSLPTIAAGLAALPLEAPALLGIGVQRASQILIAAAQGTGEVKGDIHEAIKQAYLEKKYSPEEAEKLATEAQAYTLKNAPTLIGGAAFGALDALTGFEKSTSQALRNALTPEKKAFTKEGLQAAIAGLPEKAVEAPTYLGQAIKTSIGEAIPEGLQGGYGQLAQNVAMSQAGFETPTFQGVAGAAARDALVGALTGAAMSPLGQSVANAEYEADKYLRGVRSQQEFEKQRDEFAKAQMEARTKQEENLGISKMLALPAPAPKAEEEKYTNPAATISRADLPAATSGDIILKELKFVDDYRKQNGLPPIKSYSIEDIKDAMPGIDPEGEQGRIDAILASKYGYKPVDDATGKPVNYTPADVVAAAEDEKNIATGTKGFNDFLTRTTGSSDLNTMTQPQLFAAYSAIKQMPASEKQQVLPEGTGASRFTQKQYNKAVSWFGQTFKEFDNQPLSRETIISDIQEATGLEQKQDAEALLNTVIKNGDLDEQRKVVYRTYDANDKLVSTYADKEKADAAAKKQGLNVREESLVQLIPPQAPATKRQTLPAGYEMTTEKVKEGEIPEGFEIYPEGRGKAVVTVPTMEETQGKIERLTGLRRKEADKYLTNINRDTATLQKARADLEAMEARGQEGSQAYELAKTKLAKQEKILGKRIERSLDRIEEYSAPLKVRPTEKKKQVTREKVTVTKQGKALGSFPDNVKAQEAILVQMTDEELAAVASDGRLGAIADRAQKEIERRQQPAGIIVKRSPKKEEETPPLDPAFVEAADEIAKKLVPILQRMGLKDVGLKIVQAIKSGGDGSYKDKLIKLAIDSKNHLEDMHHEALHALKDLGFFTPQQWATLENQAKKTWIDKYLKNVNVTIGDKTMSRYDGYVYIYKTEPQEWNEANPDKPQRKVLSDKELNDLLIEEAIADAFADFATGKPPGGMIASIIKRLNEFFKALRNAIMRSGFESAEDIFGKAQRGELKGVRNEPTETVKGPSTRGDEGVERLSAARGREQRGGRREVGSNTPLAGSPVVEGASGPDPRIVKVAEDYAKKAGIPFRRQSRYADVYVNKAKRIGQAYENMKHDPQDPAVKEAYEDLIRQTRAQYDALTDAGYKFSFFDGETDPYDGNPWNAMRDLRENKKMAVYGTYDGFGTEGITAGAVEDNPLLADTGLRWKDQNEVEHPVTANDLFRAVHDAFGHGMEGAGFRAKGEENAWQAHSKMYTGPALGAMTSETRGQNSWLNFGPYGEKNRTAKVLDTVFAEQKTGLMPEWTWSEGLKDDEEGVSLGKRQEGASTFDGIHYGNVRTNSLAGSKYGTGIRGSEAKRLDRSDDPRIKNRVYFYIEKPDGDMPIPEAGVGNKVYTQRLNNILAPGKEMSALSREAFGDSNTFESLVVDAGYDGYAAPEMGMMVVLNHDVPVNYQGERAELLEKLSLRIMRGEEVPALEGKQTINTIGKYFDDQVMAAFGRKLSFTSPQDMEIAFKQAIDEVTYQMKQPRSGLDWYDQDVKDAFKTTAQIIPELKKADKRILFSVISGILSPNVTARDNWFIGAKAFQHYLKTGIISGVNPENGNLWQGGTQSANKKVQMEFLNNMVANMGEKKALTWLMQDHPVSEINEFRRKYGNLKSGIAGKMTDIKPGLYAFGPKVGPFVSNLNGIHDVTVDKWMTRTFNRYFGTMIGPDGDIIDSPTEPQRRAIKELINRIAQDANIKPYQVQSLLWFYEQKLFTKLGVPSPSYEFSDGARKFYDESRGAGGQPSGAGVTGADEKLSLRSTRQPPESKEFKQWFTGSYFTSNGEPLVMYHGTARDITIFKGKQAKAIFVTTKPEVADVYAGTGEDYMREEAYKALTRDEKAELISVVAEQAERDGTINQTELNEIQKNLKKRVPDLKNLPYQIEIEIIDALNDLLPTRGNVMPVYVNAKNIFDYANKDDVNRVYEWMMHNSSATGRMQNPDQWLSSVKGLISRGNWNRIESEPVQEAIRALGFDGFSVLEAGTKNYAVYDPTQIKSVTGNIGTWGLGEVTTEQAKQFGMTAEQAKKAQEEGDIRFSLRKAPDTPEFKRWFGSSKVVNDDGEPLVVYHGTRGFDGNTFKPDVKRVNRTGNVAGYYFAPNPEEASGYSKTEGEFKEGAQVIPAYLSIKNPYVIGESRVSPDMVSQYKKELIASNQHMSDEKVKKWAETKLHFLTEQGFPSTNALNGDGDAIQRILKAGGYDGYKDGRHWVAFDSNQIKSATGNVGTYNPETGDIRYSLKSTVPSAINASIEKTTTVREQKGFVERMMDAISPKSWSDLRAKALNRYEGMSVADKKRAEKMGGSVLLADQSAESAALMSDLAAGVTASVLGVHDRHGGVPVFRNGITTIDSSIKGPVSIFAPLAKYGDPYIYQMWQFYAGAKRARRYYKDGKEHNYDLNDMRQADLLGQQYPEFKQIFDEWNKFNDALVQYQVDTGVLSKARADEYRKYSDYIPFYRQLEDEHTLGPKVFQSISGVKTGKKLKGSEAPIADLMETIVRNVQSGIQAGMKNVAAQRAVKVFEDIGEAVPTHPTNSSPDVVYALVNGEKQAYIVADPLLYNSMQSLNLPDLPFLGFFAGPANLLRNLVTKDPGFMLANMVRDSMSAWVTSGVKMTPVASAVKNFTGALRGTSPEYQALLNAGVLGGYEFSQNVEASGKQLQKELAKYGPTTNLGKITKPFTSLWQALEKGTTASDAATRMEVYKNVMAETGNEAEALFRALEVMNFNRKGSSAVVRILTAAVPFLNARLQGLDVLYRASFGKMATQDAKAIQKSFFIRGATIMALSMMYWAMTHDDDDYKKQEQETRDNYWLLPKLGVKIPIPFEVGVIFKVIPERIAEYYLGTDTGKDFADAMKRNLMSTFAFNPIPQVVLPLVEARTNYSFFTGRPIIGQGLEGVAPEYQVGPSTSRLAKWLGSVTGQSPMKIDHVIGGYTGTFGMYAVDAIDAIVSSNSDVPKASKRFEQMPVLRRFLIDPEARGNVTAYYDLKNATDEAVRTSNFLERTMSFEDLAKYDQDVIKMLASADLVKSMDKDMKDLQDMVVTIRSANIDSDRKRDLLTALNQAQNNMVSNIKLIKKSLD